MRIIIFSYSTVLTSTDNEMHLDSFLVLKLVKKGVNDRNTVKKKKVGFPLWMNHILKGVTFI